MILFWIILIVMLLLAIWFVVAPLIGIVKLSASDQNKQNILIAKEQLNDLKQEQSNAALTDDEYQLQKSELQKALISNVTDSAVESTSNQAQKKIYKFSLLSVLILIPSISIPVYLNLGSSEIIFASNPHGIPNSSSNHADGMPSSMDEVVKSLSARLQQNPDDIKGWRMLGRTYMSLRRFSDAADVYAQLYRRVGDETEVLLLYADALIMSRNGQIKGLPFQLVLTALEKEPNNKMALWLAGVGYSEKKEYEKAISLWSSLLSLFNNDEKTKAKLNHLIAQGNLKLSAQSVSQVMKKSPTKSKVSQSFIDVTVTLGEIFKDKVNPDDLVFIYVKASQGPPMPLAAVRKRVSDLPITVRLDDTMAMMPQMTLSSFSVVNVGARISKSGSPISKSGDFQGVVKSIELAAGTEIKIVIDTVK